MGLYFRWSFWLCLPRGRMPSHANRISLLCGTTRRPYERTRRFPNLYVDTQQRFFMEAIYKKYYCSATT